MRPPFQFKRFRVEQGGGVHPVGTDGVLLGAWTDVAHARTVLDIGAGTGLLALMLAQRTELQKASIAAVELNPEACVFARRNFATSPWAERLTLVEQRIQDFSKRAVERFDLIVSNPPFFEEDTLPPEPNRRLSRSATALPMADLLDAGKRLLAPGGRFCVILPPAAGQLLVEHGALCGLYCTKRTAVHSRAGKPVERLLIQLERTPYPFERAALVIFDTGQTHSKAFADLTRPFFLHIP